MGPDAKNQLTVGVGALAGSTIMLLTLPWGLAVYAGRVNLDENGQGAYHMKESERLSHDHNHLTKVNCASLYPTYSCRDSSVWQTGVNCSESVASTAKLMLLTALPYVLIQCAAFGYGCANKHTNCSSEGPFPLVGLAITAVFFLFYIWFQVKNSNDERAMERRFLKQEALLTSMGTGHSFWCCLPLAPPHRSPGSPCCVVQVLVP